MKKVYFYKHPIINIILIFVYSMLMSGCSKDDVSGLMDQNIDALIATRSIERVMCVDAYVNDVFKGTHCWVTGGGLPSLPVGAIPSPQYRPDGYPYSQGGSGTFNQGTQWVFSFNQLQGWIGFQSSLNLVEKEKLTHVLQMFIDGSVGSVSENFYEYMKRQNITIDYSLNESMETPAHYIQGENKIEFQNINSINLDNLYEELVHAVQDNSFYGDDMLSSRKNCEFEAKFFVDLAGQIGVYEGRMAASPLKIPITHSGDETFGDRYMKWILKIVDEQYGYFHGNDRLIFKEFCAEWNGYDGSYSPTFEPRVVEHFFNRPIPPQNFIIIIL